MEFEWDDAKNQANVAKHGVSFEYARRIFEGFTFDVFDDRHANGEVRTVSIGMIDGCVIVAVVHADRNGTCRIISARQASRMERRRYGEEIQQASHN